MFWSDSFMTYFHRMVNNSIRCAAKAAEMAAARVKASILDDAQPCAADDVSTATTATLPAEPVAAGARGDSPRANDDGPQVELIYSGESDGGSDSKKTPRSPESITAVEYEPTNRTRADSQTMVTTGICLVRRMIILTHPPRLLLRILLSANAVMT